MSDVFTTAKRSWVMSRIRGKDTAPERVVRSFLHKRGFRFRLHASTLPGKPDIVLRKYRTAIFVHGCFWHHHAKCKYAVYPAHRKKFWRAKIDGTILRDRKAIRLLRRAGWLVLIIWECEVERNPQSLVNLESALRGALVKPFAR
jgi:DNA mismatch endonuclease (patch repair protein)